MEIWSKATKHGPLSLKLQKGAPALAEDALLPSRCALFEWIIPPPCRGVKLNFTESHNEKWQSHPDPNTSGFNSFTCHTQQKSDQTVNRKSALPVKPLHGLMFALNQGCQTSCPLWPQVGQSVKTFTYTSNPSAIFIYIKQSVILILCLSCFLDDKEIVM